MVSSGCRDTTLNMSTYWTIEAMCRRGGSFVQALGEAASRADKDNLQRIINAFPEYWEEYGKRGEEMRKVADPIERDM